MTTAKVSAGVAVRKGARFTSTADFVLHIFQGHPFFAGDDLHRAESALCLSIHEIAALLDRPGLFLAEGQAHG